MIKYKSFFTKISKCGIQNTTDKNELDLLFPIKMTELWYKKSSHGKTLKNSGNKPLLK